MVCYSTVMPGYCIIRIPRRPIFYFYTSFKRILITLECILYRRAAYYTLARHAQ